jgi:hypothetical protein
MNVEEKIVSIYVIVGYGRIYLRGNTISGFIKGGEILCFFAPCIIT